MRPSNSTPGLSRFLSGLVLIGAAMVALTAADLALARRERAEVGVEARSHFDLGNSWMMRGDYRRAAEEYRAAVSIVRDNRGYRLAWAQALFAANNLEGAEEQAMQLLESDPGDGEASLLLGRIQVRQNRIADAIFSYRRAIYGRWPSGDERSRANVRWELTELLSKQGRSDDLLAELILLQSESPGDPEVERRVAHLYVSGGLPERGGALFQALLRRKPDDLDARRGLAEAYFARGIYTSAAANYQLAVQLDPTDAGLKERLAVCQRILALDPMLRGIAAEEQGRRARLLLELAVKRVEGCPDASTDPSVALVLQESKDRLKQRRRRGTDNVPEMMMQAGTLWESAKACASGDPIDQEAIPIVLHDRN